MGVNNSQLPNMLVKFLVVTDSLDRKGSSFANPCSIPEYYDSKNRYLSPAIGLGVGNSIGIP